MVLPASATADAAWRNEPMASRWWKADPVTNQPAPCRRLDEALVPQHLEGPPDGRAGHGVPGAELRLRVEGADVPELPEGDALPEVVGDGGEP